MAKDMNDIARFMENMKFKRRLFGGVDEADVLKQMTNLQSEYRSAYEAQELAYKKLLEERDQKIKELEHDAGRSPQKEA